MYPTDLLERNVVERGGGGGQSLMRQYKSSSLVINIFISFRAYTSSKLTLLFQERTYLYKSNAKTQGIL